MHAYFGPGIAVYTYRGYSMLLLNGSEHILYSKEEGVSQGDPLTMLFFFCGGSSTTTSVIKAGNSPNGIKVGTLCAGKLQLIRNWFDLLLKLGPSYGYFPEPSMQVFHNSCIK